MTRTLVVALGLSVLSALPAQSGHRPEVLMNRAQNQVEALDYTASQVRNPVLRDELQQRITRLDRLLDRMERMGAYQNQPVFDEPARPGHRYPGPPVYRGLSYQDALHMVRSESFDSGKLEAVRRAARNGRFNTHQARALAAELSFDRTKADALIALYPSVTDPQRFSLALDVLDFQSSRRRVANTLNL